MEIKAGSVDCEDGFSRPLDELWSLDELNPKKRRFPCCLVWTPLPIVSWLAPYIGHVGICLEDGAVLDFAGSNFVNVDGFAYGAVAKYLQLDRKKDIVARRDVAWRRRLFTLFPFIELHCCFPANPSSHTCRQPYLHAEGGTSISWDDALDTCMQKFQHKCYNMFTCNCHSFVSKCLNRLAYDGHVRWNLLNLAAMILWKGRWVDRMSVFRSLFPFTTMVCIGILMAGWPFLIGMASLSVLLIGWFIVGTYCVKSLLD